MSETISVALNYKERRIIFCALTEYVNSEEIKYATHDIFEPVMRLKNRFFPVTKEPQNETN